MTIAVLLFVTGTAHSMNVVGNWKEVGSYECVHFLNKTTGILLNLKSGSASKFDYQLLNENLINIETSFGSQVQKVYYEKGKLIFSDINGADPEVYIRYDNSMLPELIRDDYQYWLDKYYPGLCKVTSLKKTASEEYVATVMILMNQAKAFGNVGTHISGHMGGFMSKSTFVWLKPSGKKGAYSSSGMWQSYTPDVAKGDVFQVTFNGYFR
jgi:hypothetical protein